MKKFIVSENVTLATSRSFKDTIRFAVENTDKSRQYTTSRWDKSFIGTVVTFNPTNNKVECFDIYDFVDITNDLEVNKALQNKLANIIKNDDYKQNEFITFVKASEFEYYGFVGYPSQQNQEMRKLKVENTFMSIYIDIISKVNEDNISIDDLEISIRTHNCLKRAGINTVQQIKELTLVEVMKIRNLGRNSFDELERVLNIQFA